MSERIELPALDPERAQKLLAVAYHTTREVLSLHEELRGALDRGEITKAHVLNDAIFILVDDLLQRFDSAIKEAT